MAVAEQCPKVTWCQQGTRPHTRHQQVVEQWPGATVGVEPDHEVKLQFIIYGHAEDDVRPVLTLVDSMSLRQWNCELDWTQALQLANVTELTSLRFQAGQWDIGRD